MKAFYFLLVLLPLVQVNQAFNLLKMFNDVKNTLTGYNANQKSMTYTLENGTIINVDLTADPAMELPTADHVKFFLYTQDYDHPHQLKLDDLAMLENSTFKASRKTKFLTHGFANSYVSDMEQLIRKTYLANRDLNIICVDWADLAGPPMYTNAVGYTVPVGKQVGKFIDFLIKATNADVNDFHLIGHSLGSHVSSIAANTVTSGKIPRVTGLDPALPLFLKQQHHRRIDPSDAETVDCIHTCGGLLGFYDPLCSTDFYPNGGKAPEPGCELIDILAGACSHGRAYEYYAASITHKFVAYSCNTVNDVNANNCTGTTTALMGDPADQAPDGMYYVKVTRTYPYNGEDE